MDELPLERIHRDAGKLGSILGRYIRKVCAKFNRLSFRGRFGAH